MKRIFTLIAFVATITSAYSQVIKSVVDYEWNSKAWVKDAISTIGYNPGCSHYTSIDSKAVDTTTQAVSNLILTNLTYSASNYPTQVTTMIWNSPTNMYVNAVRSTYTYYNNTTKLLTDLSEHFANGAWKKIDLNTNTYNGSGFKTDSLNQTWDSATNAWVNYSSTKFTNNSAGMPVSSVTQIYYTNNPVDYQRDTYTYNSSGKLTIYVLQHFLAGLGWFDQERDTYTYNSSGKQTSELEEVSDGTTWTNSYLSTTTYDANGNITTDIDQTWDEELAAWVNDSKQEYTYGACGVLPLVLLNFNGVSDKDNMLLTWNTSAEVNTSHFDIERSENGHDFAAIGTLAGKGNSSSTLKYAYADKLGNVLSTKIYYRLRMVDKDGSVTYSNIVSLSTLSNSLQFALHPNPATSFFKVFTNKGKGTLTLRNVLGSTVLQQVIKSPGDQQVNTGQLSKGIYTVTITTGDEMRSQRIVIQ